MRVTIWNVEDKLLKLVPYWTDLDNTTQNVVLRDIQARWEQDHVNWGMLAHYVENYVDTVIHNFSHLSASEEGIWEVWAEFTRRLRNGL